MYCANILRRYPGPSLCARKAPNYARSTFFRRPDFARPRLTRSPTDAMQCPPVAEVKKSSGQVRVAAAAAVV
jgi:hypothetical protein